MALPSSGPLSIAQIATEFKRANHMAALYGVTAEVPGFGSISIAHFYGKAASGEVIILNNTDWVVPIGVNRICFVAVSKGGDGNGWSPGGGGAVGWKNNVEVTPGEIVKVNFAYGRNRDSMSIVINNIQYAIRHGQRPSGGNRYAVEWDGGGDGGHAHPAEGNGGGGAGGYLGNGGRGDAWGENESIDGTGGGGGGGARSAVNMSTTKGGGGGGVGLFGIGPDGQGATELGKGGRGGSHGQNGSDGTNYSPSTNGNGEGGAYGGGGGASLHKDAGPVIAGGPAAVRIIWGEGRSFPYNAA